MRQMLDVVLQVEVEEHTPPLWTASTNRLHLGDFHGTPYGQGPSPTAALRELAAKLTALGTDTAPAMETIKAEPLLRVEEDG